jgi:hypothetical protein
MLLTPMAIVLGAAPSFAAPITNGSFETHDFSGWNLTIATGTNVFDLPAPAGSAAVMDHFRTLSAADGSQFAVLGTSSTYLTPTTPAFDTYVSQIVWMDAGQIVSGLSSFYNGDFIAQDTAWIRIFDELDHEIAMPWQDVSGFGAATAYLTASSWSRWQWEASTSGAYRIAIGVTSHGDDAFASYAAVDAVRTPEPSGVVLTASGFGLMALGTVCRRRRALGTVSA